MSDWLLSARDLMWLGIASAPIILGYFAGSATEREQGEAITLMVYAFLIQGIGITLLYLGIIQ